MNSESDIEMKTENADLAAVKDIGGLPIPTVSRSSIEETKSLSGSMNSWMSANSALSPTIPIEFINFLNVASVLNFDISHAVDKSVKLSNTGHNLIIEDATDQKIEAAQLELSDLARDVYPYSAGVDGLLNHYFRQLAVTGVVSSEDVLTERLDGVRKVAIVPAASIRFVKDLDDWVPCQKPSTIFKSAEQLGGPDNLIRLNPITYQYFASETVENSPYAIPPMCAAIQPMLIQSDMIDNLKFIMRKIGLLGLIEMSVTPPQRKPKETDREYRERAQTYLSDVANAISENYRKGVMVHYNDQEMKHFNVSGAGAAGAKQLVEVLEQFLISGARFDPAMLGRNYNSTETFARVIYNAMVKGLANNQRIVKRRLEHTYYLHLILSGLEVKNLSVAFNDIQSLSPNTDELANSYKVGNTIKKMDKGIIDPDRAAQELGYDEAADPERALAKPDSPFGGMFTRAKKADLKTRRFRFDAKFQKYVFDRPRILVSNLESPDDQAASWINDYLSEITPTADAARENTVNVVEDFLSTSSMENFTDADEFADSVYGLINETYAGAFEAADIEDSVKNQIKTIYSFYRLNDISLLGDGETTGFSFDKVDKRALNSMAAWDKTFISTFVNNEDMQGPVKEFLKERFLEDGESMFGRMKPEVVQEFRELFSDNLEDLADHQVKRIINSTVSRSKTWGHLGQLSESGWETAEVVNGANPCPLCQSKSGHVFSVATARTRIDELSAMGFEGFINSLKETSDGDGGDFPLFHPGCHCRVRGKE
jgi:hypothetical protein